MTLSQIEATGTLSRNATELMRILPGMTPVTTPQQNRPAFTGEVVGISGTGEGAGGSNSPVGSYAVNGTSTEALDITVDGAPGGDPGCHCATAVNPNAEMTREFKVLQANYGAEHAKGPVALSVVSKSGGRDFHGTLYTVLRNYKLNSNEWYGNKVGAERAKNEFFYPGFGVSGPLLIPGTKFNTGRDKAFFYLGYEYFKQRLDTGFVKSWVPTQAMRQGDFSQAASLGLSGGWVNSAPKGFAGGIIPQDQIDPGGRALLGVMPVPNADPFQTGGYNYVNDILVDQNGHQLLARVDWNTSESSKLFVRYARQREVQPFVIGLWERSGERQLPYPSPISGKNQSDSVTVSLTHVFDPTLTNEAAFAVTYINLPNAFDDPMAVDRAGLAYPYGGVFGQSPAQIPSVDSGGGGASGPLYYAPGGFDPARFAEKWQITLQDNVTKIAGSHTLKFGAYYEYVTNNEPGANESNGLVLASTDPARHAGTTGNSFADLLLGRMGEYREYTKNVLHNIRHHVVEAYAQDSWRVGPRLTLDFGLRASYLGPWTDREGIGMAAWDLSRYESDKAAGAEFPGISWNAKDSSVPLSGSRRPSIFLTPRAGFAYDARGTGATVVRGGFGVYRYHEPQAVYASLLDLPAGVRSVAITGSPTLRSVEGTGGGAVVFNGNTILGEDGQQPVTYSWSFALAQRLPWSMNVEAGYVGNKSDHLRNETLANDNPVPVGAMYRRSVRRRDPLPTPRALRSDQRLPPQSLLELQRPPGAPFAPERPVRLHPGVHVLEEPGDPHGGGYDQRGVARRRAPDELRRSGE